MNVTKVHSSPYRLELHKVQFGASEKEAKKVIANQDCKYLAIKISPYFGSRATDSEINEKEFQLSTLGEPSKYSPPEASYTKKHRIPWEQSVTSEIQSTRSELHEET